MRATTKRILLSAFAAAAATTVGSGCVVNQYAAEPDIRMDQLLNQSEDYRQIGQIWRRFWFNDMPSHMSVERIHGGVM